MFSCNYIRNKSHIPPYKIFHRYRCHAYSLSKEEPPVEEVDPIQEESDFVIHTPIPEAIAPPCRQHQPPSASEDATNAIMEAAGHLTEAVSRFVQAMNTWKPESEKTCGLFRFQEWWDLTQVTICTGGKEVSGIPIFVKEDTIRVVDKDHSYFIPLSKVDYIRTEDGLCANEE